MRPSSHVKILHSFVKSSLHANLFLFLSVKIQEHLLRMP